MGTIPIPQGAQIDPETPPPSRAVAIPQGATIDPAATQQPGTQPPSALSQIPGRYEDVITQIAGAGSPTGIAKAVAGVPGTWAQAGKEAAEQVEQAAKPYLKAGAPYPGGGDPLEELLRGAGDATGIPFLESADKVHQALQTLTSAAKLHEEWQKLKQSAASPTGVQQALQPGATDGKMTWRQLGQAIMSPPGLDEPPTKAPTEAPVSSKVESATPKPSAGKQPVLRDAPPEISSAIHQAAAKYDLPARLIQAVVQSESSYNPKAFADPQKGGHGEKGLMQLLPETRAELGMNEQDAFDVAKNIDAGTRWLKQKIEAHGGDLRHGVTAYNGSGEKARQYADRVMALYGSQ